MTRCSADYDFVYLDMISDGFVGGTLWVASLFTLFGLNPPARHGGTFRMQLPGNHKRE